MKLLENYSKQEKLDMEFQDFLRIYAAELGRPQLSYSESLTAYKQFKDSDRVDHRDAITPPDRNLYKYRVSSTDTDEAIR